MAQSGWRKARIRKAREFKVNVLAKIWFRTKYLRLFREWSLRRRALPFPRLYLPLDGRTIRILRLQPGSALDDIKCNFSHVNLDSPEQYVALSYTWGVQAASVPILVDGNVVLVTENLYLALLHLRKRGTKTLWVDALCINQKDVQERSSQIQQMKDVYEKASMVVVWLGDEDLSSAQAFDTFHEMVEHLNWKNRVPEALMQAIVADSRKWKAIVETLDRPWFRRTWVIQEVLAAREVVVLCGKDTIDMTYFLRIIYSLLHANLLGFSLTGTAGTLELVSGPMEAAVNQLKFLVGAREQPLDVDTFYRHYDRTLLNLLRSSRLSEATDPRDKIYGLLSVAEDVKTLGYFNNSSKWVSFKVDYNLSIERVFIEAAKSIIGAGKTFKILEFSGGPPNRGRGMPSWVPNWADRNVHSHSLILSDEKIARQVWRDERHWSYPAYWHYVHEGITFNCNPKFAFGKHDALIVRGIHFDTIFNISQPIDLHITLPTFTTKTELQTEQRYFDGLEHQLDLLHTWVNECTQMAARCFPYPTEDSTEDALWRTLNDDFTGKPLDAALPPDGHLGNIHAAQSALTSVKNNYISNHSNDSSAWSEIVLEAALSRFETLMSATPTPVRQHNFATTRNRYVGLVPHQAQVGDLVCVIHGCERPFILRKCGGGNFEFVGHGKIQGFDFDYEVARLKGMKCQRWKKLFDFPMPGPEEPEPAIKYIKTRKFNLI